MECPRNRQSAGWLGVGVLAKVEVLEVSWKEEEERDKV